MSRETPRCSALRGESDLFVNVPANGILTVSAIDKGTGKSESIVITK